MSEIIFEFPSTPQFNFLIDLQGASLYQKWLELGNNGDYSDFLAWLKIKGDTGSSAYEVALSLGFVGTESQWLNSLVAKVSRTVIPTDSPLVGEVGVTYWYAVVAGTYTNFGGVVVSANSLAIISRNSAGTFTISQTPIASPINKITPWVAQSYLSGDQVNHLGKDWVSNAAIVAGDIPGTSSKWVERLIGYANDLEYKYYFTGVYEGIIGFYLDATGLLVASSAYNVSDFIKTNPLYQYVRMTTILTGSSAKYVVFYDVNKALISSSARNINAPIPANAEYMRFTYSIGEFFVIKSKYEYIIDNNFRLIGDINSLKKTVGSNLKYINGEGVVPFFNNGIDLNTVTLNATSLFAYDTISTDVVSFTKLTVRPKNTSVIISVRNKITDVLVESITYTGLTTGTIQNIVIDITVDLSVNRIFVSNFYYVVDANSPYTFTSQNYASTFRGYMSYSLEAKKTKLASKFDIEKIENKFRLPGGKSGAKVGTFLEWKSGELGSKLFSTDLYSVVGTGLSLNAGVWNNFKNGNLATQEHVIKLSVYDTSIIQLRAGIVSTVGVILDFSNKTITASNSAGNTIAIPVGFLSVGINNLILRYTTGQQSSKISLFNEKTSSIVHLDLVTSNRIGGPLLGIIAQDSNVILKEYNCSYPYQDIDVVFMGDSITEGVSTTNQYALLFKQYTGLKVATVAYGGASIGLGVTGCLDLCKFRPKVVCAMFGANGGNSIASFLQMQDECDKYGVTFLVHHMPCNTNVARYNAETAIIQNFINNYAFVKQSARFDIATAIDGVPANGYDATKFGDAGVHPNDIGHQAMFNRMLMDCPILFNLF